MSNIKQTSKTLSTKLAPKKPVVPVKGHTVPTGLKIGAAIAGAAVLGAGILIGQRAYKISNGEKADLKNPLDRAAAPVSHAADKITDKVSETAGQVEHTIHHIIHNK